MPPPRRGFTIIEVIVILIIMALMVIIVVPHFLLAYKKDHAAHVRADLETLNSAVERYALENGKVAGVHPSFNDLRKYLDPKTDVYRNDGKNALGDRYEPFTVGERPRIPFHTGQSLSSTADREFWSPYQ